MNRIPKAVGLAMICLVEGCLTAPPTPSTPSFREKQLQAIFSIGRDPSEFFIHRYKDPAGHVVFTGYNRQPQETKAVLLFESPAYSVLPLVRVRAPSGTNFLILADTTCRQNWVSLDDRAGFGMIPVGPDTVGALPAHLPDEIPGYLCILPVLELDRLCVDAVLVYARTARTFWPMQRHADARAAQAVMGVDLMRSFAYVTWDYANRMMELSSTEAYQPQTNAILAELPISIEPALGAVQIPWTLDGRESQVIFDSAGNYEVAMTDESMEPIRQIGLQDLVLRRVLPVSPQSVGLVAGETPYLGAVLLRRYRVTLDNRRNVLWIESVPSAAAPATPSEPAAPEK